MAALESKAGKIVAVEPVSENFSLLKDNVEANRLDNAILVKKAISKRSGLVQLYRGGTGTGGYRTRAGTEESRGAETCGSTTMKELMSEYSLSRVDFVKMDIEGAEFATVEDSSWLQIVDQIALEVHNAYGNYRKVVDILFKAGFEVTARKAYDLGCVYLYGAKRAPKFRTAAETIKALRDPVSIRV
jgi:FkbM family methyltransferase